LWGICKMDAVDVEDVVDNRIFLASFHILFTSKPRRFYGCECVHRVQRSEVRAERLVFLAKDNRHNMLRTCVTRVTYIFTAGQITVGS